MKNDLYTTCFGTFPVRFVRKGLDVFVARDDLFAAMVDCFTPPLRDRARQLIDGGLVMLGDTDDRKAAVLGDSTIGPAIHFHAVGNLLMSLSELTDVENIELRESSFRINALCRWYLATLAQVDDYFGRDIGEMMASVKARLDRLNPPLMVEVLHGDGMFTAVCDALHLVTEAPTFEELTERVWELAPDMIEANDVPIAPEHLRLSFTFAQSATGHRACV